MPRYIEACRSGDLATVRETVAGVGVNYQEDDSRVTGLMLSIINDQVTIETKLVLS